MNPTDWQQRLEAAFSKEGVYGRLLGNIIATEQRFQLTGTGLEGYQLLCDSFLEFFAETLQIAAIQAQQKGLPAGVEYYHGYFLTHVVGFRRFRAADILLHHGYPLSGLALLRDLKDMAVFFAGVLHGLSSFARYEGFESLVGRDGLDQSALEVMRKTRIEAEKKLWRRMTRVNEVDEETREALTDWGRQFDFEVHGSRFTKSVEGADWLEGTSDPPLGPDPRRTSLTLYFNSAHFISWMFALALPGLQLSASAFGADWAGRWSRLDDSFRVQVSALAQKSVRTAAAVLAFVDRWFGFTPQSHYRE